MPCYFIVNICCTEHITRIVFNLHDLSVSAAYWADCCQPWGFFFRYFHSLAIYILILLSSISLYAFYVYIRICYWISLCDWCYCVMPVKGIVVLINNVSDMFTSSSPSQYPTTFFFFTWWLYDRDNFCCNKMPRLFEPPDSEIS